MAALLFLLALPFAGDVGQLAHPSWHAREAATRRLAQAGPIALPAVLTGLESADLEVRHRCCGLVRRCERLAIEGLLTCGGWCSEREAAVWVGREGQLESAAVRLKLWKPGRWPPPWCGGGLDRVPALRAFVNWCRSVERGGTLPDRTSWKQCVDPHNGVSP